jgi:hypothetical protein
MTWFDWGILLLFAVLGILLYVWLTLSRNERPDSSRPDRVISCSCWGGMVLVLVLLCVTPGLSCGSDVQKEQRRDKEQGRDRVLTCYLRTFKSPDELDRSSANRVKQREQILQKIESSPAPAPVQQPTPVSAPASLPAPATDGGDGDGGDGGPIGRLSPATLRKVHLAIEADRMVL